MAAAATDRVFRAYPIVWATRRWETLFAAGIPGTGMNGFGSLSAEETGQVDRLSPHAGPHGGCGNRQGRSSKRQVRLRLERLRDVPHYQR